MSDSGAGFRHLGDEVQVRGWRISVVEAAFAAPDGTEFERDVVRHPGAVAVVAVTDNQEILLVRQYRGAVDRKLLEIPAGTRDVPGEPPERTAARELTEEVGVRRRPPSSSSGPCTTAPGSATSRPTSTWPPASIPGPPPPTASKSSTWRWSRCLVADVDAMLAAGDIVDAQTVLGLLLARPHCAAAS